MRTLDEAMKAFTPGHNLSVTQKHYMELLQKDYKDLVSRIFELVPPGADRTSALRKLLDSKMTCMQAITHPQEENSGKG